MRLPSEPRSYLGLALCIGILGFSIGGCISAIKGTGPDAAMIASISTLLAALAGGLVGNEIARNRKKGDDDES